MTNRKKHISLLFLGGALISLVLLATSLSNLKLRTGTSFLGSGNSDTAVQPVTALPQVPTYSIPLLRGIFALLLLVLIIFVVVRIYKLVNKRRILWLVITAAILFFFIYMIPNITLGQPVLYPTGSSEFTTPPSFKYPVTPLGQPPQELIWFVIILILLGMCILAIKIVKQWLGPTPIEAELLQEAEHAVNALEAGMDLRNVIMRCYLQMTRSLQEEQGIERDFTMTVREFERWLNSMGFPTVPVHQLSTLFEKVRYGEEHMGENDEMVAVDSLNKIIEFCRRERV